MKEDNKNQSNVLKQKHKRIALFNSFGKFMESAMEDNMGHKRFSPINKREKGNGKRILKLEDFPFKKNILKTKIIGNTLDLLTGKENSFPKVDELFSVAKQLAAKLNRKTIYNGDLYNSLNSISKTIDHKDLSKLDFIKNDKNLKIPEILKEKGKDIEFAYNRKKEINVFINKNLKY